MARKSMMGGWSLLALGLVVVLVSAKHSHAFSCEEAASTVAPCKPFLVNDDRKPSAACCTGLQALERKVASKNDLQDLCECLKNTASKNGFKPDKAKRLPQFCGATFPDPTVDCSKIA